MSLACRYCNWPDGQPACPNPPTCANVYIPVNPAFQGGHDMQSRDTRPDGSVRVHVLDGSLPGNLQHLIAADVDRAQCGYAFEWYATDDDLVHYIYGNQGPLFMEDAQPYRNADGSISIIAADDEGDTHDIHDRIFGSWEDGPGQIAAIEADNASEKRTALVGILVASLENALQAAKELAG